ncbi:MAG: pantoate--beta-alanine ligase [Bacteroidota bacterium]
MEIIKDPSLLVARRDELKEISPNLGFIPTMGALHAGHISLVRQARQENGICVVSIFVNPTQFNDPDDFNKYPRYPDKDIEILREEGVDIVFMPDVVDVYPTKELYKFDLGGLDEHMEGAFRPGHFDGVADVVYRLFNMVKPDRAYFGDKDFQQKKIIERMVEHQKLDIEIFGVPIVRESDGLAMSSRNQRLNNEERKQATHIYKMLKQAGEVFDALSPEQLKSEITRQLNESELLECEYVEIVHEKDLSIVTEWNKGAEMRICVAVWAGNVRLIDNIKLRKNKN